MQRRAFIRLLQGAAVAMAVAAPAASNAADRVTIHLDQYNGYFAAQETLAGLKPGEYEFIVANKAGKLVGFELRDLATGERLDMFPLEPGQTRSSVVQITANGFRYRCPINPTPWYEVSVGK
ncbi:MAG: hypothetical protein WDZ63_12970 [Burkholderiales bacterium]